MSKEIDQLLDLRNKFDEMFSGYTGDVVVSDFRCEIDNMMREITNGKG